MSIGLDSRILESCGTIIKQDLWNCNGLEAFPIPMMPPIRALVVALGVVGAILEAIFYRPNYRRFVAPMCSAQSSGQPPMLFKSFRLLKLAGSTCTTTPNYLVESTVPAPTIGKLRSVVRYSFTA